MSQIQNTTGAAMRGTIRSGAFELAYSVEGSGPPAIVIGSAVYYPRVFSAALRQSLRLVFLDHRGFAKASGDVPVADYALDLVLDDIERARRHLGLGKVVIVGHSGHGYMALEYAKRHPDHVSHVVMIATGPSHSPAHMQALERHWQESVCPERKERLARDLALLPAEIEAAPEKRFVAYCVRMGARSWYDHTFDGAPLWEGVHVNMPAFDHLWGEVFRDIDIAKGLDGLDVPVLLALGRSDYLVAPYETWEPYRERFRDLTVRVFEKSGHTPQFEESELFDAELLRWLKERGCPA
ncbi:alpha/beta hydrolase [Microvirga subterranea]|uniref:Proline iminopeptidase n=1 Tax=Microvirga subterranea TaxID=186651 RepID=A0A370HD45_9HYPH|nr:alpha/beta hydrolase [Microvirga subterranea]RDI55147.1 proline iminopeptidase [Microvirga subterranea]